ncbi:hypothetical protein V6N12_062150 [Hibiscus sabdariffa]|uniref:Uncharacterized protein n=1 Tax=Hibiscus sabdariffa TaxID=183260 RepID=A0ABR2F7Z6_9ROSI
MKSGAGLTKNFRRVDTPRASIAGKASGVGAKIVGIEEELKVAGQVKTSVSNGLVDVSIITEAESQDYSAHSVSIEPIFGPVTGLFSVRPKTLKHNKICTSFPFRSIPEKTQGMKVSASNKPKLLMKKTWKNNEERPVSVESEKKRTGGRGRCYFRG